MVAAAAGAHDHRAGATRRTMIAVQVGVLQRAQQVAREREHRRESAGGPARTASCRPSPSIQLPTRKASSPTTPAS